jgi:NTP pyrophosphatase (non-canonical NTP hydrolase)
MSNNSDNIELSLIQKKLEDFAADRNWKQFHSTKNLSMALSGEVGELMELLQWLTEEQSNTPDEILKGKISEELSDIFLYLLRIADLQKIDLIKSSLDKMQKNAEKYPINKSYGSSKKYTELKSED